MLKQRPLAHLGFWAAAIMIPAALEGWLWIRELHGASLLETRWLGYTPKEARAFVDALGTSGARWYTGFQLVDMFFIFGLAGALLAVDRWSLRRLANPRRFRVIIGLPIGYAAADLAEDLALLGMVWAFRGQLGVVGRLASGVTTAKFALLGASIGTSLFLAVKAWRRRA